MGKLVNKPTPGCVYQHYKGGYYYCIGFALNENTESDLVLYRKIGTEKVFARPVMQFLQKGKTGKARFRLIEKLNQ